MITETREKLAAELADIGVPVHTAWPDRFEPPCVLLVPPQGEYLSTAGYGGQYTLSLDVVAIVGRGSYDVVLPALEALIGKVLEYTADWSLSGVDSPSLVTVGGTQYLGTVVHISRGVYP